MSRYPGADPGFSDGGSDKRPPTISIKSLLIFNKYSFHKKRYGQNSCVCFTLGGLTESPELPLDPPEVSAAILAGRQSG